MKIFRFPRILIVLTMLAITLSAVPVIAQDAQDKGIGEYPFIELPKGYQIEKYADGLTFPTSLTWDDQGRMYVAEAGGGLNPEQLEPSRIMLVERGNVTEVVNLTDKGVFASVVGLTWHDGAFYFTHRNDQGEGENSLTGAASRWVPGGEVEELFSGIIDSQSEHQINDIKVGPDGRMYVTVGAAGNAGVVDTSIAPWVMENPGLHTTPCEDIVLTGRNFKMPNFMTMDDPDDTVLTGAYVPFGTETFPGQVIEGVEKCGGSILVFDPDNAEATIDMYAWGFRNLLGLAWNDETGEMYVAQNGYDIRGSRPVQDEWDPTYRVREGEWYGVPDYSAAFEPLTDPKFEPPDEFQAEVFVNGESVGKTLDFVIDHEASGLDQPDTSLILGLHEFNSSPSFIDVAPDSWGEWAGHVFVAEWGDLAPPTNPLRGKQPAGARITRVDPATGQVVPFVWNAQPGPASMHGMAGQGMERPFDVKFGPDGAMYIVDYGVVTIDMERKPPYNYVAGTGTIWKVTRTQDAPPQEDCHFFEETGHQVCNEFLEFWHDNGGLAIFGYPLTGAFMEANPDTNETYLVQYFERERFELHPENAGTVYHVLLGRLGAQVLQITERDWQTFPKMDPGSAHYFPETGFAIAPEFWEYWSSHGLEYGDPGVSMRESLLIFGYPISPPVMETNADGDTVLTQWFERAVFEYHPDNPAESQVLLRRLGAEVLSNTRN